MNFPDGDLFRQIANSWTYSVGRIDTPRKSPYDVSIFGHVAASLPRYPIFMSSTSARNSGGASFCVACGVLAIIAIAQLGVGLWGMKRQQTSADMTKTEATIPLVPISTPPSSDPSGKQSGEIGTIAPVATTSPQPSPASIPRTAMPKVDEPFVTQTIPLALPKTTIPPKLSLDVPITDPDILEQLEIGMAARKKSDNQVALEAFRNAWKKRPDHPSLIYQLAETLDQMGLEGKAQPHWNTLISLGHAAGDYYELAEMRIKNKGMVTPGPSDDEEKEKRLVFSDVQLERAPGAYHGDKKILKFTIKKKPEDPIAASDLWLVIHFFDLKNGRSIDRTYQATPQPTAESTDADWQELGMQRLKVVYDLGEMSPAEIVQHGQRNYYGYVLELYVQDPAQPDGRGRLQDIVAEPAELANFAREMKIDEPLPPTANAPDSPLFPR